MQFQDEDFNEPLLKNQMFGRYQIEKELGRGGMGVVYKAFDKQNRMHVALKLIIKETISKRNSQRFSQEVSAIAKLNHPNIVRFYESGVLPKPYFAMEYIEGYPLSSLIKKRNIKPIWLLDTMISICEALKYAHENRIIHRDIKPENIMIAKDGTPKIMDFGLVKLDSTSIENLSKTGEIVGTAVYMAPEQINGKTTYKSDIYAIGATIYEALTYRQMFQGENHMNLMYQILREHPIPPRKLNPDISPYFEAICLKCIAKKQEHRYDDTKQLTRELKNLRDDKPIIAKRYSYFDTFKNIAGKYKVAFVSGIIFAATILVLIIFLFNALQQAKIATKKSKDEHRKAQFALRKVMKVLNYSIEKHKILGRDKEFAKLFSDIFPYAEKYGENQDQSFMKGSINQTIGSYKKSFEYYNEQIKNNPKYYDAYNNRGFIYYNFKKYDEALSDYNKAININPKYDKVYNNRGSLYYSLKKYSEALNDYNKAININPDYREAYNNRGLLYYNLKKFSKALDDFNKAISLNPEYYKAYKNRGRLYSVENKYLLALKDYNKAIKLNPEYHEAYKNRGFVYYILKKYTEALNDYNKAISLNSKYFLAYNNRAILFHDLKKYTDALNDYNKAININPEYFQTYDMRGTLYHTLKRHTEALNDYNKAISINPKYDKTYNNRGLFYCDLKKYPEALNDYNKAINLNPKYNKAYNNRGVLYYILRKYPEALNDYNKSIELYPEYFKVYNNRGFLYYTQKKYSEALNDYDKAIKLNPKSWLAHRGLYLCYKSLGDSKKAKFHLQQLEKLKPKSNK